MLLENMSNLNLSILTARCILKNNLLRKYTIIENRRRYNIKND